MNRIRPSRKALLLIVIPAKAGLRRQDAEANIGKADGPQGEPQDAASNPLSLTEALGPGLHRGDGERGRLG